MLLKGVNGVNGDNITFGKNICYNQYLFKSYGCYINLDDKVTIS